ncbi:hypothetical protein VN97_g11393 [Penicillium thymicola]|uniref:Uncharacterized protein n=1 Tax=Penicillium thymicola TaxID=293382 RepID=A0AAI9X3H8_PENTH|nr:hypothetical protein VN97_g11393 [Penicillium thymicola]
MISAFLRANSHGYIKSKLWSRSMETCIYVIQKPGKRKILNARKMHDMNNMNANMNNALIRANTIFIYSYSRGANMIMPYIRIHLFLSEPIGIL